MNNRKPSTRYVLFPTAIGSCGIAWRGEAIVATCLPEPTGDQTAARLIRKTGGAVAGLPPVPVASAIAAIGCLLDGGAVDLAFVHCDYGPTDPLRRTIYDIARTIPPGQITTYGAIALRLGNQWYAQAVGQAMGQNPLPIIVPCHRVMGAKGQLTGFSANGGVATKLRMLEIERAAIGVGAGGLFDHLPLAVKAT